MRAKSANAARLRELAGSPPSSGPAGPPSPRGEAQTVEKGAFTPWPPLRGGSRRSGWGRELYGNPKYFGLWQGSLPPPLRGTSLAEGGFSTRCAFPPEEEGLNRSISPLACGTEMRYNTLNRIV